MQTLAERIAQKLAAIRNCERSGNQEWLERHSVELLLLMHKMPSGSGFDAGTQLEMNESNHEKLVFTTSFHHMNDVGMYDGWTQHKVTVKPSFMFGFVLQISGRDKRGIKDYIAECFNTVLSERE